MGWSGRKAASYLFTPHRPHRPRTPTLDLPNAMLDRADAAWVVPVRAVLWGCKTVPCVSLCVWVFFDDDKLLSAPMASAHQSPLLLPTDWFW